MTKKRKKKKSIQKSFRKTVFTYDQYWNVQYTELLSDKTEKDFKTIIKARSADLAKLYLKKKIKEDSAGSKLKSFSIFMFHKDGEINTINLSLADWESIKDASFPNEVGILFKYENPRPEGYTNRFNRQTQSGTPLHGFKKGHAYIAKKNQYTSEQKRYMLYNGKWYPWPKQEREALKEKIILNFKSNGNSRVKTSKALGFSSCRPLKKLLDEKFTEIDWSKDFPSPRSKK